MGGTATKPYVNVAAYLHRRSDDSARCGFDPKKATDEDACPFPALNWNFLECNADKLATKPRMSLLLASVGKKSVGEMGPLRKRAAQAVDAHWGAAQVVTKER
jgi:deoxyribodipyrimidine photolyase-related protein